ncbi:MAG: aldo/keto reductase [Anaerolineales bacterium]|jgi:aryl-alcohol dehydrogenase-like predicted oxidoreductase
MEYVKLGRAGVRVSRLCLGCINFGGATEENDSIRMIHRALDVGINFLDTANIYYDGHSEVVVGKALAGGKRESVFLATKVRLPTGSGPNDWGNSRLHIIQEVEKSLKRLNTDHIDLYQLHRPDPETPIVETLRALTDLVQQGKVRYIGSSTFPAWRICEALWTSELRNLEYFVSEQPPYNILWRGIEQEVLPFCQEYGLAVLPWSPLAMGFLTGKYKRHDPPPEGSRASLGRFNWLKERFRAAPDQAFDIVEKVQKIADEHGKPITQFALRWSMTHPVVTSSIIGPRTMEQLEDCLSVLDWDIDPKALEIIDQLVPPGTNVLSW